MDILHLAIWYLYDDCSQSVRWYFIQAERDSNYLIVEWILLKTTRYSLRAWSMDHQLKGTVRQQCATWRLVRHRSCCFGGCATSRPLRQNGSTICIFLREWSSHGVEYSEDNYALQWGSIVWGPYLLAIFNSGCHEVFTVMSVTSNADSQQTSSRI